MFENLKKLIYTRNYDKNEVIKKLEVLIAINQINSNEYNFILELLDEYPSNKL